MNEMLLVNRVAFSIGGVDIYWYGVVICLAILAVVVVAMLLCKRKNLQTDLPLNVALVILPTGILCGRLFAVMFDDSLSIDQYFNFRTGGMSIIGAIVGGAIGLTIYCLIKKEKNPLLLFDVLCSVLLLAQAIGRWGNYFNGEVYGQVIEHFIRRCSFMNLVWTCLGLLLRQQHFCMKKTMAIQPPFT